MSCRCGWTRWTQTALLEAHSPRRIEVFTDISAINELAGRWDEVAGDGPTGAFSSAAWYQAWADAFPIGRPAIVAAWEGTTLAGVLPVARTRTDVRGAFFSRIAPLARADYQAPIILPGREAEILPELLDAATSTLGRRGVLWWPNLLADSPGLAALRAYLRERNLEWVEEMEWAPRLDIGGRSYAEIEKSWTASHRGDVRRQRRRLIEQGTLALWQPTSVDEALPVLDEFFAVHDAKWLSQGYPGRFADPREREHFRAVLRRMLGGRAHFSVLRCGSTNISYLFGLESGGYIQSYRPTFLPAYANFSPSKVHIAMLLEQACARGMAGVDFLLGAEPYKLLWGAELVGTVSIHAALSRVSLAYAWFSRAKPYLRGRFAGDLMRLRAFLQRRRGS